MTAMRCILVVGMHRSGTSALTGALGLLGVRLGSRMVPPGADNPGGYFEHADAVRIHERLLLELGRGWDDLRPLPEGWLDSQPAREALDALAAMIQRDFADAPLWALKDPRVCRLLPLWKRVLTQSGIEPAYLFALRAPADVVASLRVRDGLPPDYAQLLWAQHLIMAELDSRGATRAVVDFRGLLADPVQALETAGRSLGLVWPVAPTDAAMALRGRLDPGQCHHSLPPSPSEPGSIEAWVAALHEASASMESQPEGLHRLGEEFAARCRQYVIDYGGFCFSLNRSRQQAASLADRLEASERGLEEARKLSLERLEEVLAAHRRLDAVHMALEDTKKLSIERLSALHHVEALAAERLAFLRAAESLAEERLTSLSRAQAEVASLSEQLNVAQGDMARILASRSWRFTRPLRVISARLRRFGRDGSLR